MDDRRSQVRARTMLSGQAVLRAGSGTVNCVVRDLSQSGTQLEPDTIDDLGGHIRVRIGSDSRTYLGRVRWVRDGVLGVELVEPRDAPEVLPD